MRETATRPFPSERAIRRAFERDKKARDERRAYCDSAEGALRIAAAGAALNPDRVPGLLRALADGVRVYGVSGSLFEAIGMVAQSGALPSGIVSPSALFAALVGDGHGNPPAAAPTTPSDAPTVDNGNPSPFASPHPGVTRATRKRNRAKS